VNSNLLFLAVVFLIIIVGVVAFVYTGRRGGADQLDARMEELAKLEEQGRDVWNRMENGEYKLDVALQELHNLHARADQELKKIRAIRVGGFAVSGMQNFEIRKRNAEDIARATSEFLFALATAAHFRFFGNIAEGAENQRVAVNLNDTLKKMRSDYQNGATIEGLDSKARPVTDDSEYIFVVLVDAARADHIGSYGYKRKTSPTIDTIAGQGLLFENAFSQCSTTDTSVASIMTSLYPRTHKMVGRSDWLWENILIDGFRKAGYTTGAFSANSLISKDGHFDNGFDFFRELPWARATITFTEAIRWIERARGKHDKIFAYIHLIDPHDLYFAPFPFFDKFDKNRPLTITAFALSNLIENKFRDLAPRFPECDYNPGLENWDNPNLTLECVSKLHGNGPPMSMRDVQNMEARYDGEILYSDAELSRFIGYLEEEGMLPRSTIVVLADHGESFMEHNRTKHGRVLYDNEVHVPLVFWRGQNNWGGKRISRSVELIDLMPTLLRLAGAEVPRGIHGRDLLKSNPAEEQDPVFALSWNGNDIPTGRRLTKSSVREPDFKYIRTDDYKAGEFKFDEFYSLATDPGETSDARKKYPEDFRRLREKLEWWNEVTDKPAARPVKDGISPEKMKKLKDLGYVE